MTKIKNLFLAVLFSAAVILQPPAQAQNATARTDPTDYFAVAGTAVSTNVAYAISPARGGARGRWEFLSGKSDSSGANLRYGAVTVDVLITNALAAASSNILVSATNGIAVGDVIVIRSVANDTYQKAVVGPTISAAGFVITNETTSATTAFALAAGDHIYRYTMTSLPIGATRCDFNGSGGGVWYSQANFPGLVEVNCLPVATLATNNFIVMGGRFVR